MCEKDMMPQFRIALASLAFFALPAFAQEATPLSPEARETVESLIGKGLADKVGYKFVEGLTTEIGPRLAGSEAEARARDWAVEKLTNMGFDRVAIETFQIPYWSRLRNKAEIISPAPQNLMITALGGSASTPEGGITADIVRFTSLDNLKEADSATIAGKIVFLDETMTRTMDGSGYGVAVAKRRSCVAEAVEKGGLACLIRSVGTSLRRFPHAGMMARGEATGPGPGAALSSPDADQLARLLENGPVTIHLDIQVETKPSVTSGNVIAEITGSENPEEIVLIGGHLDSWDLGTGAVDDGAGVGIAVAAAKLIMDLDERPKRTIRVVLYGAEEVGLLGGHAYARAHAAELPNHILAAESDFGADKIWRFDTRFGEGAMGHAKAMFRVLAPLGIGPGNNQARGGPDITMLARSGVPVVTPLQNGLDYFDLHHTPDDTFDKIDPEKFNQNIAAYAAFTWLAANMGWDFRQSAPESE